MNIIKIFLTLLLFSLLGHSSWSQETEEESFPTDSFENPRSTMRYFLKTMKAYKEGDSDALDLAIKTFDTTQLEADTKIESSKLAARRLIQTIDRIKFVKINKIPKQPKNAKWTFSQHEIILDQNLVKAEIAIAKTKNNRWLFTPLTLQTIESYHLEVANLKVVKGVIALTDFRTRFKSSMPLFTGDKSLGLLNGQWIAIFLILLLGLVLDRLLKFFVNRFTDKIFLKNDITLTVKKKKEINFPHGAYNICRHLVHPS